MDFLQFMGYFFVSMFLYQTMMILIFMAKRKFNAYMLKRLIDSGRIKIMSVEDFAELQAKDKKTWN